MKKTMEIAVAEDFPTHRLTVKLTSGGVKELFFSAKEAVEVAKKMNDLKNPSFIFGEGTPFVQVFPKLGATLEIMTNDEIRQRHLRYFDQIEKTQSKQDEERRASEEVEREAWIVDNSAQWNEFFYTAKVQCDNDFGKGSGNFFDALSSVQKKRMYKNKARILLKQNLFSHHL